jgi:hypothetical protein
LNGGEGGTVFKITPSGTLTTVYSFCSQGSSSCTDGTWPDAARAAQRTTTMTTFTIDTDNNITAHATAEQHPV